MTMIQLRSVGFCAHYCDGGDWAFDWALRFARLRALQLNIFRFTSHPYTEPRREQSDNIHTAQGNDPVELEKAVRLYYEERCGDYVDVGFRVCEGNGWNELHRCLMNRQFQLLVLAYEKEFMGTPMDVFANQFISPVVLVGPNAPDEIKVNAPAALIADTLKLDVKTPVLRESAVQKQVATLVPIDS